MEIPASLPEWPGGADVAVALTFDVDAEAPWLGEGPEYASRLTMLSQARFGPARGLGRVLDMLAAAGLPATFYVPGHTADQHPATVEAILERGHEIGHHGYQHPQSERLDEAGQRAELEQGLTALGRHGVRPGRLPVSRLGADAGHAGAAGRVWLRLRQQPDGRRPAVLDPGWPQAAA